MTILTQKLPEWKIKRIDEVADLLSKSKTIGLVDIKGLPAKQFHNLRAKLRDKMNIRVVKKTIIKFAIEKIKDKLKNIGNLEENMGDMPTLIFSDLGPFQIAKLFGENKAPSSAKPGDIAPEEIKIDEGPTPFVPGPMMTELSSLGLKVKVEAGKISVVKSAVIAKQGEPISEPVASLLLKLGVQPMEVGLELTGAWEDGFIYKADILRFDVNEYLGNLENAASSAFNLSIGLPYPTKQNIAVLITKAFNEAKILAKEKDIFVDVLAGELLAKASAQASELGKYVEEHQ
jgi:large subunit ribosomal protein L10